MFEKTLSSKKIYDGRVIKLRVDEIETDKGVKQTREVVSHGGGAAVLVVKDGKILLEKQFRYPYKEIIWEIPAGKRDKGEDFIVTARRELEEETGYVAEKLVEICKYLPSPGYTDEVIRVYRATCLTQTKAHLDEGEFLTAKWFDKNELKKMIARGEINDGKTLVALLSEIK